MLKHFLWLVHHDDGHFMLVTLQLPGPPNRLQHV